MIDQLVIDSKASYDDYGASVKTRTINNPVKKSIKETVPFSNVTYDFSAINGELYWEERELEYVFEITADTPEKLEEAKTRFCSWVMNVMNEELHDPFIENYHFTATFNDMNVEDDESVEKTTLTVTFTAYPYKIADEPKLYTADIAVGNTVELVVENNSSHKIVPTIITDQSISVTLDNVTYNVAAGTTSDSVLKFNVGVNTLSIKNNGSGACNLTINIIEEVF